MGEAKRRAYVEPEWYRREQRAKRNNKIACWLTVVVFIAALAGMLFAWGVHGH